MSQAHVSRIFNPPRQRDGQQYGLRVLASAGPAPAPLHRAEVLRDLPPRSVRKRKAKSTTAAVDGAEADQNSGAHRPKKRRVATRNTDRASPHPSSTQKNDNAPAPRHLQEACLARAVQMITEDFEDKKRLSEQDAGFTTADPDLQVRIAKECYGKLHDTDPDTGEKLPRGMLPERACVWCQIVCPGTDFVEEPWEWQRYFDNLIPGDQEAISHITMCDLCFPRSAPAGGDSQSWKIRPTCKECHQSMAATVPAGAGQPRKGQLSNYASHGQYLLRCAHQYPKELCDLSPIEEKIIGINMAYGFITKLRMDLQWIGPKYRKHVKGHICVFPSPISDLCTNVLPRALESTLENVLVVWSGKRRPEAKDLSSFLSIRPAYVARALVWLRRNNPLYANIQIDDDELTLWTDDYIVECLRGCVQHFEPTAEEEARTANYIPSEDLGVETESGQGNSASTNERVDLSANDPDENTFPTELGLGFTETGDAQGDKQRDTEDLEDAEIPEGQMSQSLYQYIAINHTADSPPHFGGESAVQIPWHYMSAHASIPV